MGVNQGNIDKLCSVGVVGSVSSILTKLSNRSQHVMLVYGCRSKVVNIVSGVPQGSVFGHVIAPPINLGAFFQSGN